MKEAENEETSFYMCWAPGVFLSTSRCVTIDQAKTEAASLSRKHGHPVYVMKAVGVAVPNEPPVAWFDIKEKS